MTNLAEASQLFDVDVNQLAGSFLFVVFKSRLRI